jgi:hypothetical protein
MIMKSLRTFPTKLILILVVLQCLSIVETKAQNYIPLLDTAKQWNVTETYYGFSTKTFFLKISGNDTLINNTLYKTIWQEGLPIFLFPDKWGFIREDTTNKRVYGIKQGSTEEFLLYDFSLAVGDTVESEISYYCANTFSVQRIDTITLLNNEKRRKWTLGDVVLASPSHYYLEWIEGIGNLDILMYPTSCTTPHAPTYSLLCYYENDTQLYKHPIYDTCYIDYVSSVYVQGEKDLKIIAYPNPVKDFLNIETSENIKINQIKIYNLSGQEVFNNVITQSQIKVNIALPNLTNGMYIIQIETEQGVINKKINVLK